ncbi:MAG: hypothetical protein NVSMB14_15690 [Isosphaeraceae bacterium]
MTSRTRGRLIAFVVLLVVGCGVKTPPKPTGSPLDFTVKDIDGKDTPLSKYKGKVLIIVNTAAGNPSRNGYAVQLEDFETLYRKYKKRGFEVLAFPSNSFGKLEPGTDEEIKSVYQTKHRVTYPIFAKLNARSPDTHPLFKLLEYSDPTNEGELKWNFTKFLVGRDGQVIKRYDPDFMPEDPRMAEAIEAALGPKEKTDEDDSKDNKTPKDEDAKK